MMQERQRFVSRSSHPKVLRLRWGMIQEMALNNPLTPLPRARSPLKPKVTYYGFLGEEWSLQTSWVVYLISLLFSCKNTFLGFELDLLIYKFLAQTNLWIFTYRNPWYLYLCSIYFSHSDSSCLHSAISYPESLSKSSGYSEHKTRSFRAYT